MEGQEASPKETLAGRCGGDSVVPQARGTCWSGSEASLVHFHSLTHSLHRHLLCLALSEYRGLSCH